MFKHLFLFISACCGVMGAQSAYGVYVRPARPDCDRSEQTRAVTAVTSKPLIGSGSYTISVEREVSNSQLQAPLPGTPVEVVRCLPPGRLVQLATGKIDRIEQTQYLASVFVPSKLLGTDPAAVTKSLVMQRNLYWQPMEGDFVRLLNPNVAQRKKVWPRFEFEVGDLFETRSGDEWSLVSLSLQGRQNIVTAFEQLEEFQGRFVIESAINSSSITHEQANEISQLRAGLVANYLSQVFEMPANRVIARGLGRVLTHDGLKVTRESAVGEPLFADTIRIRILSMDGPATASRSASITPETSKIWLP